jgi:hypothetical protein
MKVLNVRKRSKGGRRGGLKGEEGVGINGQLGATMETYPTEVPKYFYSSNVRCLTGWWWWNEDLHFSRDIVQPLPHCGPSLP